MAFVSAASSVTLVEEDDISALEELLGKRSRLVGLEDFQRAREERRTANLEFDGLRVGDVNSDVSVLAAEVGEGFITSAERKGEHFSESSACSFGSEEVSQLVQWLLETVGASRCFLVNDVVVTISDGDIFDDVARVKDIATAGRNGDTNERGRLAFSGEEWASVKLHLLEEFSGLGGIDVDTNAAAGVSSADLYLLVVHVGSEFVISLKIDVHFFLRVGPVFHAATSGLQFERLAESGGVFIDDLDAFDLELVFAVH